MKAKKLIQFDWAMKTLLRREENFPILEGLLSELLRAEVTIQSLMESESNKKHADDKSNRVDIFAVLDSKEKVIIELQVDREWDFLSRILYGVSKVVVDHLKEGDRYGEIPRVISVNIVYFNLGHGEDYIYHGTTEFKGIHKKDQLQLTTKEKKHYPSYVDHIASIFPEYYILKVSGFDLTVKDPLDEWIYALKESEVKPEFKAKGIREAGRALAILNLSEKEQYAYDRYINDVRISRSTLESSYSDGIEEGMAQGMAQGIVKGMAQGVAQGMAQERAAIIEKMHGAGVSVQEIARFLDLSEQQIGMMLKTPFQK